MPFEKSLPEWNKAGTEPPQSLKDGGWQANQKPPADYFNWFFNTVFLALQELQNKGYTQDEINQMISSVAQTAQANLADHTNRMDNPHGVTAEQAGAVPVTDVVTSPTANKLLKLDGNSKLPASITGNADGNAATASKLKTARTLAISGDATGSVIFDGSSDKTFNLILANTGVAAGTFTKITVDAKGRVVNATTLSASDIPNLDWSKITSGKPTTLAGYGITDALPASSYNAADVLAKIKTVDGSGSGLDADTVDGKNFSDIQSDSQSRADSALSSAKSYTDTSLNAHKTSTTDHAVATTTANGFMSAADKTKLNGIAAGAQTNQNAFSNVLVGSTTIAADNATDTLTLAAGANITLTPDATNDKVTIAIADGAGSGLDADTLDGHDSSYFLPATGNAPTASKLQTARTITAAGDATGSVSFDGSTNVTLSLTLIAANILSKLLTVDGSGSGLDADLLDGHDSSYFLAASAYSASDVLAKLKSVDGSGSGVDADLLDGHDASYFAQASLAQMKKITADNGGVTVSVSDTSQDFLAALTAMGTGMNTFYCIGGAVNAPSTKSTRGISYFSAPNYGIVFALDYSNTLWTNYMDNGNWVGWRRILSDADQSATWYNLPLSNGAKAYNSDVVPQYCKVGNIVYLRGAITNVSSTGLVLGTLPAGYRPSKTWNFIQNTSQKGGFGNSARWAIGADGTITLEYVSSDVLGSSVWLPLFTDFPTW
ncbi:hypothetical protein [Heyndrickxia ginsengihumi]|uniref:hypothetical protein n=1 Tax=Heyndrickxia ginsengihumi TaxID=363870 RepID=UPI00068D90C0|nr:hypothetical protein [Heyndrickxia ginsengihumi]